LDSGGLDFNETPAESLTPGVIQPSKYRPRRRHAFVSVSCCREVLLGHLLAMLLCGLIG